MRNKYKYPKILEYMKKHKESQVELSEVLGMTDITLRNKLAGNTEWTISEIQTLCKHYKTGFYKLFKMEE